MRKEHFQKTNTNWLFKMALVTTSLLLAFNYGLMAQNTAYGTDALKSITSGKGNIAFGYQSLYSNATADANTANGYKALFSNISGMGNTANGNRALFSNTGGHSNIANGANTLYSNTTGQNNVASGVNTLYFNTTGNDNTANGGHTLSYNTTGSANTANGAYTLLSNTTGSKNTGLGYLADVAYDNLNNATAIGYNAKVNASNKVVIGNSDVTVIGGYANWSNLSDARFKKDIQKDVHGLDFIMQLKPISYNLDIQKLNSFLGVEERNKNAKQTQAMATKETIRYNGFLAQEVEQAAAAVQYNFSGVIKPANAKDHYSMSYSDFVVPLVKGMQEQEQKIEAQEKTIQQLQQQMDELKKLVIGNVSVTKDPATKQLETAGSEDITLYPNPTTGLFTITTSHIDNGVIEIYDMAGNSMQKTAFNNAKAGYQLNVSGYAKGVYLLAIIANNKKYTKRLVIH